MIENGFRVPFRILTTSLATREKVVDDALEKRHRRMITKDPEMFVVIADHLLGE